jgi:hypothetical protein
MLFAAMSNITEPVEVNFSDEVSANFTGDGADGEELHRSPQLHQRGMSFLHTGQAK